MQIGAVICEYNPFHNGHKYHIEQTKEKYGVTHMVAVMSGNFTQRGDVAIFDKWQRAETALRNGIDLVIELPVSFSLASAEYFAMGTVTLLDKMKCINILSFGSECADIELLEETAGAVQFVMEQEEFHAALRKGKSYPVALQSAVNHYYEDIIAQTLSEPNNTLGVEYIKAIDELGSAIKPVTIERAGAKHDSDDSNVSAIVSASKLRRMIAEDSAELHNFMPCAEFNEYAVLARLELPILSKLRSMSPDDIRNVPNVMQGLENRIYKAARVAGSLGELFMLIKSKRYTLARIRRIVLNAFLDISKNDLKIKPSYIRILGMNARGKEILQAARAELPMDTSLMALSKTSDAARRQAHLENICGNQYALCFNKPRPCGIEYTHKPVIID